MSDVLQELVGQSVQVYWVRGDSEGSDIGTLEAYDGNWLRVRKDGTLLFFSIARVRLVKPV